MRLATVVTMATLAVASMVSATGSKGARCFPDNFLFGSATASYQVEGAVKEGGRTPSIWDDYCRSGSFAACANVADDFYHRYKNDTKLMLDAGLQSFRFSISWSRLMNWDPTSKRMKVNPQGVQFYHSLVDELRANKIEPILTMYHWDLPSELQTQFTPGGWLNSVIQDHFVDYAELLYNEFGQKINFWATINEPSSQAVYGYNVGYHAPGINGTDVSGYTAAHNMILGHAKAVARFRDLKTKNIVNQKARIGIVLASQYYYPLDPKNPKDVAAADRGMQFDVGTYLSPITTGDYPAVMRERVGDRLPKFTAEEAKLVKGSYDLFMFNHYTSNAVTDCDAPGSLTPCDSLHVGPLRDAGLDTKHLMPGSFVGQADVATGNPYCQSFTGYAPGYLALIKWFHEKDPKADILLTENGFCGNDQVENKEQLEYFQKFVEQVYIAVQEEKIPVIGYTAWSFMDNYEWGFYVPRFGLYSVNFTANIGSPDYYEAKPTELTRQPRPAAKWFKKLSTSRCLDDAAVSPPPAVCADASA